MDGGKAKDFLNFQVNRKVTSLYKSFLFILEDLQDSGYNISDSVFQRYRKRVLDHGNDTVREINEVIEKLKVELE
jgi:hypothetical protein